MLLLLFNVVGKVGEKFTAIQNLSANGSNSPLSVADELSSFSGIIGPSAAAALEVYKCKVISIH